MPDNIQSDMSYIHEPQLSSIHGNGETLIYASHLTPISPSLRKKEKR